MRVEVQERDGPVPLGGGRSSGSAMVWSPPSVTRRVPFAVRSSAAAWIASIASPMSNGFAAMSPASATCATSNGDTSSAGL